MRVCLGAPWHVDGWIHIRNDLLTIVPLTSLSLSNINFDLQNDNGDMGLDFIEVDMADILEDVHSHRQHFQSKNVTIEIVVMGHGLLIISGISCSNSL